MKNKKYNISKFRVNYSFINTNESISQHLIIISNGNKINGFMRFIDNGIYSLIDSSGLKNVSNFYFKGDKGREIIEKKSDLSVLTSLVSSELKTISEDQRNLLNSFIPFED